MNVAYADLSLDERKEKLALEAKKKETRNYMRSLQQSEIDAEKGKFASDASEKKKLKKELENLVKSYKDKISAVEDRMEERLEKIETGKMQITGMLYGIPDFQNKRMLWRDQYGELVDSRDLLPDEMTGNLFAPDVNKALEDLPFDTQQAVQAITNAGGWEKHNEAGWAEATPDELMEHYGTVDLPMIRTMIWDNAAQKYVVPVSAVEHNEAGWEVATDAQLMAQYGTVDISLIRTMDWNDTEKRYDLPDPKGKEKPAKKSAPKKKIIL